MASIVFIGFRGSGKSTLGRWLAEEVDLPFIDTDDVVLEYLGFDSVVTAWDEVGEKAWREAELHVVPSLLEQEAVISLGGGAPMIPVIQKALTAASVVFNLTANEIDTKQRIETGVDRPRLIETNIQTRLDRLPLYAMLGTCGVDTSCDMEQSKIEILNFLKNGHQMSRTGRPPVF